MFVVSRRIDQTASIMYVLSLRQAEVRNVPASSQGQHEEAVILDKGVCFRVERVLYRQYLQESDIQALKAEAWDRAVRLAHEQREMGVRSNNSDLYERSMKSYWKTTVFNRYGGELWLFTLIATGRVHPISIEIVNEIFARRILDQAKRESQPTATAPVPWWLLGISATAQPQPQARGSSRGQVRTVRGVQHQKIPSALLRDKARHADKLWRWNDDHWWKAQSRQPSGRLSDGAREWWSRESAQLRQEADRLWAEATEESIKVKKPFKGRDGTMVYPEPRHEGTFEQSMKILVRRIEDRVVTWPPP